MFRTELQETYELQDFVFYDPSSQENVSKYSPSYGLSLTFEDDHYTTVLSYDNWKSVRFADNLNLTDFEIEYDVKFDGVKLSSQFATANVQSGFELNNSFFFNFSPIDKSPFDVKYDTWYHVKATGNNGTFTVKVFENDIEVYSLSQSAVTLQFLEYRVGWERGAKTYLKNISVKAL